MSGVGHEHTHTPHARARHERVLVRPVAAAGGGSWAPREGNGRRGTGKALPPSPPFLHRAPAFPPLARQRWRPPLPPLPRGLESTAHRVRGAPARGAAPFPRATRSGGDSGSPHSLPPLSLPPSSPPAVAARNSPARHCAQRSRRAPGTWARCRRSTPPRASFTLSRGPVKVAQEGRKNAQPK